MSQQMFHKGLFIDLDGTLYNGNHLVDYADVMIERLREAHVPMLFLSNNSTRSPQLMANHMLELGIQVNASEIFTSAIAATMYLLENRPSKDKLPSVYCIGEKGLRSALGEVGIQVIDWAGNLGHIDFVVQGLDRELGYDQLTNAVQCILNGAKFIQTNPDLLLPWNNQLIPGAGAIGAAIEAATGTAPTIIGKPSPIIMKYALDRLNQMHRMPTPMTFKNIWTVGDNLRTDIAAGQRVGCVSCLTLTGLATEEMLPQLVQDTGVRPDKIFPNLRTFTDAFLWER